MEMFTPVPGLGQRDDRFADLGGQGVGDHRGVHVVGAHPDRPVHHVGQAVLAHHRRLLQGPRQHQGLGAAGGAAAVGDDVVRIDVVLSYHSNDQFTALQAAFEGDGRRAEDSGIHGFWFSILVFVVLATIHIVRTLLDLYLMQRFIIAWRVWLTQRLTGDWLDGAPTTADGSSTTTGRQPGPTHPAGRRRLHHRHRPGDQHADRRHVSDAVVRGGLLDRVGGLVHPDPVESVRAR